MIKLLLTIAALVTSGFLIGVGMVMWCDKPVESVLVIATGIYITVATIDALLEQPEGDV